MGQATGQRITARDELLMILRARVRMHRRKGDVRLLGDLLEDISQAADIAERCEQYAWRGLVRDVRASMPRWVHAHSGIWRLMRDDGAVLGWELERRTSEPGCPEGWYLFGHGVFGRRMSWRLDESIAEADAFIASLGGCTQRIQQESS